MTLALTYRPQQFEDVVGQDYIKVVLQNQIENDEVKNAYLLCGAAGTGKTTTARIIAALLSAEVIEIDGASNNGVDNVREVIESSRFKPIGKRYKVFIIDEVHMLSTGAFNALLKTLEEPPAHAVFILATTDPQKIPATILSRVQRFDFRRLTPDEIVGRLSYILEQEQRTADAAAIEYIAKLAQGGMRSAISLLDTCLSYINDDDFLSMTHVVNIVGATPYEDFILFCEAKDNNDLEAALLITENWHDSGKDLRNFVKGLADFIVDVEKYQVLGSMRYLAAPAIYEEPIRRLGGYNLMTWFKPLTDLHNSVKYDHNAKTLIQGVLMLL